MFVYFESFLWNASCLVRDAVDILLVYVSAAVNTHKYSIRLAVYTVTLAKQNYVSIGGPLYVNLMKTNLA